MQAVIRGNYEGTADFTRGGAGKFDKFSSFVGLCVPRQCTQQDLEYGLTSHFMG